jgi:heat shock protein HslJ
VRHHSAQPTISAVAFLLAVLAAGCSAARPARDAHAEARIDLETIAGRTWILESWRAGEPAPTDPQVSLRYAAGSLTGRAGCNRYTAPIERRPGLGSIAIGTIAATRMMCPPETMSTESRFLDALPRAKAIELRGTKLGIVYASPEGPEAVLTLRPE